jgi:hypothetical protein
MEGMDKYKLIDYINAMPELDRHSFAKKCGTSVGYIRKVMSSRKPLFFGPAICRKLEVETDGLVTRQELRPKDWHEIWPEIK